MNVQDEPCDTPTEAAQARKRAEETKAWLEQHVWSKLGEARGKVPSKEEQEEMLGY